MYDALVLAAGGCGSRGRHGRTMYRKIVGEICPKSASDLPDMGIADGVCGAPRSAVKLDIEVACRGGPVDAILPPMVSFTPRILSFS